MKIFKTALAVSALLLSTLAHSGIIAEDLMTARQGGTSSQEFTFSGLDSHSNVNINFDLYTYDSWDGNHSWYGVDLFGMKVDGNVIFEYSFTHQFPHFGQTNPVAPTSVANFAHSGWLDAFYDDYAGGFNVAHSGSDLSVEFYSVGLQSIYDESWQVKDIDISSVPEPSVIALLGLGLAGMGFSSRRKKLS